MGVFYWLAGGTFSHNNNSTACPSNNMASSPLVPGAAVVKPPRFVLIPTMPIENRSVVARILRLPGGYLGAKVKLSYHEAMRRLANGSARIAPISMPVTLVLNGPPSKTSPNVGRALLDNGHLGVRVRLSYAEARSRLSSGQACLFNHSHESPFSAPPVHVRVAQLKRQAAANRVLQSSPPTTPPRVADRVPEDFARGYSDTTATSAVEGCASCEITATGACQARSELDASVAASAIVKPKNLSKTRVGKGDRHLATVERSEPANVDDGEEYELEKVLKHYGRGESMQFRVKYVGYADITWQPIQNFIVDGKINVLLLAYVRKMCLLEEANLEGFCSDFTDSDEDENM